MRHYRYLALFTVLLLFSCKKEQQEPAPDPAPVQLSLDIKPWAASTKYLYVYALECAGGNYAVKSPLLDHLKIARPSGGSLSLNLSYTYAENKPYDFSGYYVGDGAVSDGSNPLVTVDESRQQIFVTLAINGTQDILVAHPDREQAARLSGMAQDQIYSANAARRDIHPRLEFRHVLSAFSFTVRKETLLAEKMTVKGLSVESYTSAKLVVAGAGQVGELQDCSVPASLPVDLTAETPMLMVMPGEAAYRIRLELELDGVPHTATTDVDFSRLSGLGETSAQGGALYQLALSLYGPEDIRVSVSRSEWETIKPEFSCTAPSSTIAPAGGEVRVPVRASMDYTFSLAYPEGEPDWLHLVQTRSAIDETLVFRADPNPGRNRRARLLFSVNGKSMTFFELSQEGMIQFPDQAGIYFKGEDPVSFDQSTSLLSTFTDGTQLWTRILIPYSWTVYELGPMPADLADGVRFDTAFRKLVRGTQAYSRSVNLMVAGKKDGLITLVDPSDYSGFIMMY